MARDFFLSNPTCDIPALASLRYRWNNVPNEDIREVVVVEEQYLIFFKYLLLNLRHTEPGYGRNPPDNGLPIFAHIRAVAIKSALMTMCSIMEAVLLSHAVKRNYRLPSKEHARSFGKIIEAWENDPLGKQILNIDKNLILIKHFKSIRDNFHLTKSIRDESSFYERMLVKEEKHIFFAEKVLNFLATIRS